VLRTQGKPTHADRRYRLLILAATAAPALAEPCVWGSGNQIDHPASDVYADPAGRIDPNAPQMRCSMTVYDKVLPNGQVRQVRDWHFAIGK
jgi:hypothetical protein